MILKSSSSNQPKVILFDILKYFSDDKKKSNRKPRILAFVGWDFFFPVTNSIHLHIIIASIVHSYL